MKTPIRIFLSYSSKDKDKVEEIYNRLIEEGYFPWMDKKSLYPGDLWAKAITKSIQQSHFFIACLTNNSVDSKCYLKKEIKLALEVLQTRRKKNIFIIPIRFEPCEVPKILSQFHWVDLYNEGGWEKLFHTIRLKVQQQAEKKKKSFEKSKDAVLGRDRQRKRKKIGQNSKNNLTFEKLALFQEMEELVYETRNLAKALGASLKKNRIADDDAISRLAVAKERLVEFMLKRRSLLDLFSCFEVVHSYKNILVAFHANFTATAKFARQHIAKIDSELKTLEMAYWITIQHIAKANSGHKENIKHLELSQQIDEHVYRLKLKAHDLLDDLQKRKRLTTENLENFSNSLDLFIEMILDESSYLDSFGYYRILHRYKKAVDEFYKSLIDSPRIILKHVKAKYDLLEKAYFAVTKRIRNSSKF